MRCAPFNASGKSARMQREAADAAASYWRCLHCEQSCSIAVNIVYNNKYSKKGNPYVKIKRFLFNQRSLA